MSRNRHNRLVIAKLALILLLIGNSSIAYADDLSKPGVIYVDKLKGGTLYVSNCVNDAPIYYQPSSASSIVALVPLGTAVMDFGDEYGYTKISYTPDGAYASVTGYINPDYLSSSPPWPGQLAGDEPYMASFIERMQPELFMFVDEFLLWDLNLDGTPELILYNSGGGNAAETRGIAHVYAYENGTTKEIGAIQAGAFYDIEGELYVTSPERIGKTYLRRVGRSGDRVTHTTLLRADTPQNNLTAWAYFDVSGHELDKESYTRRRNQILSRGTQLHLRKISDELAAIRHGSGEREPQNDCLEAYTELIAKTGHSHFLLHDIDGDGIAELLLYEAGDSTGGIDAYSYDGNKALHLGELGASSGLATLGVIDGQLCYGWAGAHGRFVQYIVKKEGNKLVEGESISEEAFDRSGDPYPIHIEGDWRKSLSDLLLSNNWAGGSRAGDPAIGSDRDGASIEEGDSEYPVDNDWALFGASDPDFVSEHGFFCPESNTLPILPDDLANASKATLAYVRNEILARHGYPFDKKEYRNYFGAKQWYQRIEGRFDYSVLNRIESENIEAIKRLE